MTGTELTLSPSAAALHTRDRNEDYRWWFDFGNFSLKISLKELHQKLIADKSAYPATSLILVEREDILGLVVANLGSQRQDHLQTQIDDAILAEFAVGQRHNLLLAVASLLDPDTAVDSRSRFLEYAEEWFQAGSGRQSPGTIRVPAPSRDACDGLPGDRRVAVRSNDDNLQRVAASLRIAAEGSKVLERPFLLVSTGLVGPESLGKFASQYERFIALSRSSNIPEKGMSFEKKARRLSRRLLVAPIGVMVLATGLVIYQSTSNESKTSSSDAGKKCPGGDTPTVNFAALAALVGGAAAANVPGDH